MMEGRSEDALRAARTMISNMPVDFIESSVAMVDSYLPIELEVLMRFGRWSEILRMPMPPQNLPQWRAYWRFARGVAFAALGRVAEAKDEEIAYLAAVAALPSDAVWGLNPASNLFGVARRVLAGEIAAADGRPADAIRALSEAAAVEDALAYDEPYDWMIPARHALGAVLLREKMWRDAERVYREDLERYPENGWALWGLARSLDGQGRSEESRAIVARFERAWAHADIKLSTSCLCIPHP
jgi:tetratricopeptide (TPR) repeat protein